MYVARDGADAVVYGLGESNLLAAMLFYEPKTKT